MAGRIRWKPVLLWGALVVAVLLALSAAALYGLVKPKPNPPAAVADYTDKANWVCLPGRQDSCATKLDATAIAADGATQVIAAPRAADPAIDCFYVYPTVSRDPTANARLAITPEVDQVARAQFARFSTVCRPFAPLYRQGTLRALTAAALGIGPRADLDLAYGDVRRAWQIYLDQYNHGRGVVLIGHSQGSRMLKRLIQQEIEGKPAQARLVSAMLIGNNVRVAAGQDTGGDFHAIRLCRAPEQTGCVVAYSSFRASAPPPPDSRYGREPDKAFDLSCTNPAALGGGKAVLDAIFPARENPAARPYTQPPVAVTTPFVTEPGLISGQCVHDDHGTYLSISLNGQQGDRRLPAIYGDVVIFGRVLPDWGLHVIDINLALGNLVKLAQAQAVSYTAAQH